jgi:hypothetical protein
MLIARRLYWRFLSRPLAETFIKGGITVTTRYIGEGEFETRVRGARPRVKPRRSGDAGSALDYHSQISRELTPPLTDESGAPPSPPPPRR